MEKQHGTVKRFNAEKGYGFIGVPGHVDLFVHQTSILMDGFRTLTPGDRVSFDIGEDWGGRKCAVDVFVIEKGDEQ